MRRHRCAKKHNYKNCDVTDPKDYVCVNCKQNHAACSKSCPELIKAVEEKKAKSTNKVDSEATQFTRNYSNFNRDKSQNTQNTQNQTIALIKLIIDLFKNLSLVTQSVHDNPSKILNIISNNLGNEIGSQISNFLFTNLDQEDPNMVNRFIEHENEQ